MKEKTITNYWIKFFPEVKDERELKELLQMTSCGSMGKVQDVNEKKNDEVRIDELLKKPLSYRLNQIIESLSYMTPLFVTFKKLINWYYGNMNFTDYRIGFIDVDNAEIKFVESLCKNLLEISIRVLIEEINLARVGGILKGETSEERFEFYIKELWDNEEYVSYYYQKYNLLYKTLLDIIDRKIKYHNQILTRLNAHKSIIEERLFESCELGKIKEIDYSRGDSHKGGKSVVIVHFENDKRLVYKPRSVKLEVGFNEFLSWINAKLIKKSKLYGLKAINFEEYGYIEFVHHEECSRKKDVKEYYVNMGKLLCVAYLLKGKDFHHENIIAKGTCPVIIDLDALFHSNISMTEEIGASSYMKALEIIDNSVYTTGLLPHIINNTKDDNAEGIDVSGMQGDKIQISPFKTYKVINKNTDKIRLAEATFEVNTHDNIPTYNNIKMLAGEYVTQIIDGFSQIYMVAMENKQEMINLLQVVFKGANSRLILRPTYLYGQLINSSQHPDFMMNKADRVTFLSRLAIGVSQEQITIVKSEIEDIIKGDIPLFETGVMNTDIYNAQGEKLDVVQEKTPFSCICEKINNLAYDNLVDQIHIIQNAFKCMDVEVFRQENQTITTLYKAQTPSRERCLKIARKIADYLVEDSVVGTEASGNKSRSWLGYSNIGVEKIRFQYEVLLSDIYSGNSGIALFFLYLGKVTGEEGYIHIAEESMSNLIEGIKKRNTSMTDMLIGPYNGISGYLYTTFEIYNHTKKVHLYPIIYKIMQTIEEAVLKDRTFDFLSGSAGALMVLKRIYEYSSEENLKNLACKIINSMIDHIISGRKRLNEDMCAWASGDMQIYYSGFAHGTAGISAALSKTSELYHSPNKISETINQALKYEKHLYSMVEDNWRSDNDSDRHSLGWCHGAPGIILNRMMLYEQNGGYAGVEDDIQRGCEKIRAKGFGNNISYCHGDLGNLEILYSYAKQQKNEKLLMECYGAYECIFTKTETCLVRGSTDPRGLMLGYTGIGYAALRLIDSSIPSILRLE